MAFIGDLLLRAGLDLTKLQTDVKRMQGVIAKIPEELRNEMLGIDLVPPDAVQQGKKLGQEIAKGAKQATQEIKKTLEEAVSPEQVKIPAPTAEDSQLWLDFGESIEAAKEQLGELEKEARRGNFTPELVDVQKYQKAKIAAEAEFDRNAREIQKKREEDTILSAQNAVRRRLAAEKNLLAVTAADIKVMQARGYISAKEAQAMGEEAARAYREGMLRILDSVEQGNINPLAFQGKKGQQLYVEVANNINNMDAAAKRANVSMGRIHFSLASIAARATGLPPVIGQFTGALSTMAAQGVVTVSILAAIAGLGYTWQRITRDSREAAKELEDLRDRLDEIAERGRQSTGSAEFQTLEQVRALTAAREDEIAALEAQIEREAQLARQQQGSSADWTNAPNVASLFRLGRAFWQLRSASKQQSEDLERVSEAERTLGRERALRLAQDVRAAQQRLELAAQEGIAQERLRIEQEHINALVEIATTKAAEEQEQYRQILEHTTGIKRQVLETEYAMRRQNAQLDKQLEARRLIAAGRTFEAEQVRQEIEFENQLRDARRLGYDQATLNAIIETQAAERQKLVNDRARATLRTLEELAQRYNDAVLGGSRYAEVLRLQAQQAREIEDARDSDADPKVLDAMERTHAAEMARLRQQHMAEEAENYNALTLRYQQATNANERFVQALELEMRHRREMADLIERGGTQGERAALARVQEAERIAQEQMFASFEFLRMTDASRRVVGSFGQLLYATGQLSDGLGKALSGIDSIIAGISMRSAAQQASASGSALLGGLMGASATLTIAAGVAQVIGGFLGDNQAEERRREAIRQNTEALESVRRELMKERTTGADFDRMLRWTRGEGWLQPAPGFEGRDDWLLRAVELFEANQFAKEHFGIELIKDGKEIPGAIDAFRRALTLSIEAITGFRNTLSDLQQERSIWDKLRGIERDPAQQVAALLGDLGSLAGPLFERFFAGLDLSDTAAVRQAALAMFELFAQGSEEFALMMDNMTRDEFLQWMDQFGDSLNAMDNAVNEVTSSLRNVPQGFRILNLELARFNAMQRATVEDLSPPPPPPPAVVEPPKITPTAPTPPVIVGGEDDQPTFEITDNRTFTVNVYQLPGEDQDAFAERVIAIVRRSEYEDALTYNNDPTATRPRPRWN